MSLLTAREVRIIARFGFSARVDSVLSRTIAYQAARSTLLQVEVKVNATREAAEAVSECAADLHEKLDLERIAENQVTSAAREYEDAQRKLAAATEELFESAGQGAPEIVEILEEHGMTITREQLRVLFESAGELYGR